MWGKMASCGRMVSGLSALATYGMQAAALCGRQSCLQAAFQAAVEETITQFASISPASVHRFA